MQPRHRYLITRTLVFALLLVSAAATAVTVAGGPGDATVVDGTPTRDTLLADRES